MLNIMISKREEQAFLILLMMFHKSVDSLQEQRPSQRDAFRHHQPVRVSSVCVDLESLIQEEMSQRKLSETVCTNDQKPKGVQHRSRTTFTQEQSKALEQGRNPSSMTHMTHIYKTLNKYSNACLCLLTQSSPTASMQTCTPERSCQPRSNSPRKPSR